jgi:hypothetical protein
LSIAGGGLAIIYRGQLDVGCETSSRPKMFAGLNEEPPEKRETEAVDRNGYHLLNPSFGRVLDTLFEAGPDCTVNQASVISATFS